MRSGKPASTAQALSSRDTQTPSLENGIQRRSSQNTSQLPFHVARSHSSSNRNKRQPSLSSLETTHSNHQYLQPHETVIHESDPSISPISSNQMISPVSPTSATAPTAATAVMAQEMSAVLALKRLSIGALPTLDPDLPNYNEAGSPVSQNSPTSPRISPSSSPKSDQSGFDFSGPVYNNSLQVPGENGNNQHPEINSSQASQLLWVPAHVHPEIAPQEWKSFVHDKLAEIRSMKSSESLRRSSSSSSTSGSIKRRNSRLSRQIKDQEGYTDGADVLEKRRSIDTMQQKHDPTIQSLSHQLESVGELEGWSVDPVELVRSLSLREDNVPYRVQSPTPSNFPQEPVANDYDAPILPAPTSSLRRSTRTRINKSSIRRGRRDVSEPRAPTPEPTKLQKSSSLSRGSTTPDSVPSPDTKVAKPEASTTNSNNLLSDPEKIIQLPPTSIPPSATSRRRHSPERKPVQRVRIPITNKPLSECPDPTSAQPTSRTSPVESPSPVEPARTSPKSHASLRDGDSPVLAPESPVRRKKPASSIALLGNDYDNVPKIVPVSQPEKAERREKPKRPSMKRQTDLPSPSPAATLSSDLPSPENANELKRTEDDQARLKSIRKKDGKERKERREKHTLETPDITYASSSSVPGVSQQAPKVETEPAKPKPADAASAISVGPPVTPEKPKPQAKELSKMAESAEERLSPPQQQTRRKSSENKEEVSEPEGAQPAKGKTRKGTWGWLFNGASGGSSTVSSGRHSPQDKLMNRPSSPTVSSTSNATTESLPESSAQDVQPSPFTTGGADKASVDRFLNRVPVQSPSVDTLPTVIHEATKPPEVVVTTSEEDVSSSKVSTSSTVTSISETKDRISNFFSKKKSMANFKAREGGSRKTSEELTVPPYGGDSRPGSSASSLESDSQSSSPRAKRKIKEKSRGRYRSRSRHKSPEPEPQEVTAPVVSTPITTTALMQNLPNGVPGPVTNAAGLVAYNAEAAAYYGAPYQIPAHQYSDKSLYMMNHRYAPHIERAIYRLSHLKLGNPRRPLVQQVLLSNFMYAYLNLINQGFIRQQQEAQLQMQQQQMQQQHINQKHAKEGDFYGQNPAIQQHMYQQQPDYHPQNELQGGGQQQYDHYGGYGQEYSQDYDQEYDVQYEYGSHYGYDNSAGQVMNNSTGPGYGSPYAKGTRTADSSSSSSSSSVAGDDMWHGDQPQTRGYEEDEMFYDTQEEVS